LLCLFFHYVCSGNRLSCLLSFFFFFPFLSVRTPFLPYILVFFHPYSDIYTLSAHDPRLTPTHLPCQFSVTPPNPPPTPVFLLGLPLDFATSTFFSIPFFSVLCQDSAVPVGGLMFYSLFIVRQTPFSKSTPFFVFLLETEYPFFSFFPGLNLSPFPMFFWALPPWANPLFCPAFLCFKVSAQCSPFFSSLPRSI